MGADPGPRKNFKIMTIGFFLLTGLGCLSTLLVPENFNIVAEQIFYTCATFTVLSLVCLCYFIGTSKLTKFFRLVGISTLSVATVLILIAIWGNFDVYLKRNILQGAGFWYLLSLALVECIIIFSFARPRHKTSFLTVATVGTLIPLTGLLSYIVLFNLEHSDEVSAWRLVVILSVLNLLGIFAILIISFTHRKGIPPGMKEIKILLPSETVEELEAFAPGKKAEIVAAALLKAYFKAEAIKNEDKDETPHP